MLIFLASFLFSSIALSFPENIRHGYPTCVSCHYSPTGGGVLTEYGRSSASNLLSTFETSDIMPKLPLGIAAGGDTRALGVYSQARGHEIVFLMQSDWELMVPLDSRTKIVGTVGLKTPIELIPKTSPTKYEIIQRRNYLLHDFDLLTVRLGRFFPAYGIMFPNHALETRRSLGFDEGHETFNVELSQRYQYGELFLTGINGETGSLKATDKGYQWGESESHGFATRATIFNGNYLLGFSFARTVNETYVKTSFGPFLEIAPYDFLYISMEYDRLFDILEDQIFLSKVSYEAIKGLMLSYTYQHNSKAHTLGINLFPIEGIELNLELEKNEFENRILLLIHSYL